MQVVGFPSISILSLYMICCIAATVSTTFWIRQIKCAVDMWVLQGSVYLLNLHNLVNYKVTNGWFFQFRNANFDTSRHRFVISRIVHALLIIFTRSIPRGLNWKEKLPLGPKESSNRFVQRSYITNVLWTFIYCLHNSKCACIALVKWTFKALVKSSGFFAPLYWGRDLTAVTDKLSPVTLSCQARRKYERQQIGRIDPWNMELIWRLWMDVDQSVIILWAGCHRAVHPVLIRIYIGG